MTILSQEINLKALPKWWLGELSDLWADVGSALRRSRAANTALEFKSDQVRVVRMKNGTIQDAVELPPSIDHTSIRRTLRRFGLQPKKGGKAQSAVLLSSDQFVCQTVRLPLAVRDNLNSAISFQIGNLTPFLPDDVYFAAKLLSTDNNEKSLEAEIRVVAKKLVQEFRAKAEDYGIEIDRILFAKHQPSDRGGEILELPLLVPGPSTRVSRPLLFTLVTILCATNLALPVWRQQRLLSELSDERDRLQKVVLEARKLSSSIQEIDKRQHKILTLASDSGAVFSALEGLSVLIDDKTYLTELKIDGKAVNLNGLSASASEVLQAIESAPIFANARFLSPINRDEGTAQERFAMSVEYRVKP